MEVQCMCARCGGPHSYKNGVKGQMRSWCVHCRRSYMREYMRRRSQRLKELARERLGCRVCGDVFVPIEMRRCGGCGSLIAGRPIGKTVKSCERCAGLPERPCVDCGCEFTPRSPNGQGASYCRSCSALRRRWYKAGKPGGEYRPPNRQQITCRWCFTDFTPSPASQSMHVECRREAEQHYNIWKTPDRCYIPRCFDCCAPITWKPSGSNVRRCDHCQALVRGRSEHRRRQAVAAGDDIAWRDLGERDGWKCHLCGGAVKQVAGVADEPMGATVDHLTPIADEGEHRWSNVALAHRVCNIRRGTGQAQLRLIG